MGTVVSLAFSKQHLVISVLGFFICHANIYMVIVFDIV